MRNTVRLMSWLQSCHSLCYAFQHAGQVSAISPLHQLQCALSSSAAGPLSDSGPMRLQ